MTQQNRKYPLTIEQVRQYREPGEEDDREMAEYCLKRVVDQAPGVYKTRQLREEPCGDCAVMDGLYSGIAGSCYRNLSLEERKLVAEHWNCHHRGRCEGAWQTLVGIDCK